MADDVIPLPAPPPGGGFLVLNRAQFDNAELRKAIAENYPNTRVVLQQPLPSTTA